MSNTIRDEIVLSARSATGHTDNGKVQRSVDRTWLKVDNVSLLAEMVWKQLDGVDGGLNLSYRPITDLSSPQKFRMRIRITEKLLAALEHRNRRMNEIFVMRTPENARKVLFLLVTLSIYTSLRERKSLRESSVEEFSRNVRYYSLRRSDALVVADIVLCGYIFPNTDAVKLFRKDVIRNLRLTPTRLMQETWEQERIPDLFPLDIYEQHAPSEIPFVRECTPLRAVTLLNEQGTFFSTEKTDTGCVKDLEEYISYLKDSLWSVDKETGREATLVDMEPLKSVKLPREKILIDIQEQDLEYLLMREYNQRNPFRVSNTPNKQIWKLSTRKKLWDCHVCGDKHTENSLLVIKDDGRVFLVCKHMPKGSKTKYVGSLRKEPSKEVLKLELKIELFMSEQLRVETDKLPFDLMSLKGELYYLNIWKDLVCPVCGGTHSHRDTLVVTHAKDTGALFLRCKAAKDTKKPFVLLGHLKTREDRRLTALSDEECIKLYIVFGVPFPDSMDERKREFFLSIFTDESVRMSTQKYDSRFLRRLAPKNSSEPFDVDTLIVESACGTGKTYSVFVLLLEVRMRDKRLYYDMLNGNGQVKSIKRVGEPEEGRSRKDTAFMELETMMMIDNRGEICLCSLTTDTEIEDTETNEGDTETNDRYTADTETKDEHAGIEECLYQQYDDEIQNLDSEDYRNYFKRAPHNIAGCGASMISSSSSVDPFEANETMFKMLQCDDYIEPETLEKISKSLDGIFPDIEPSILWISTRRTYARDIHAKYRELLPEFVLYLDENGFISQERLIISIESLIKCVCDTKFDYIVLDEVSSVLEQLYSPHLIESENVRDKFTSLIREAKNVICMDADITSETLYRFSKLREGPIRLVTNTHKRKIGHSAFHHEKLDSLVLVLDRSLKRGEKAHVVCATKKRADELAVMFAEHKPLLITSETNTLETKKLLVDLNKNVQDYGLLVHTSSLSVGVDVSALWSDACYLIADPRSVDSRICKQMIQRVRMAKKKVLHWYVKPYRRMEPVELLDIFASSRESFISSNEMRARILGESKVRIDRRHVDEVFDLSDPWVVSYLYRVQSENLKLTCHREMLQSRLQKEGYTMMTFNTKETSEAELKDTQVRQKEAAVEVEADIVQNFSVSDWIDITSSSEGDCGGTTEDGGEDVHALANRSEGLSLEERKLQYALLLQSYKNGIIQESERWVYRKSRILNLIKPERREGIQNNGVMLLKLEKAHRSVKKMKRMELGGVEKLIETERKRFEDNPSAEMSLADDNLKLAIVVYMSQLLGLKSPSEEKEVTRVSKRLGEAEKRGKSEIEVRIAEGSLETCVNWITLHQRFITGVFGVVWKRKFNELAPSTRNRGLHSLFAFGVGNRLDFTSRRRVKGKRVIVIQNKCKLNELKVYFI